VTSKIVLGIPKQRFKVYKHEHLYIVDKSDGTIGEIVATHQPDWFNCRLWKQMDEPYD